MIKDEYSAQSNLSKLNIKLIEKVYLLTTED